MKKNPLRNLLMTLTLAVLLIVLLTPIIRAQEQVFVHGYVFDEEGKPLPNTLIIVYNYDMLKISAYTYTDERGYYEAYVPTGYGYVIYAIHCSKETGVIDYVPAKVEAYEFKDVIEIYANFTLYKAAYVKVLGRVYYVGGEPTGFFQINITTPEGIPVSKVLPAGEAKIVTEITENTTKAILLDSYGKAYDITLTINTAIKMGILPTTAINERTGLIPANRKVMIRVIARVKDQRSPEGIHPLGYVKELLIEKGSVANPLTLKVGEIVTIDLTKESLARIISLVQGDIEFARSLLNKYEAYGFYLAAEREELRRSGEELVRQAIEAYSRGAATPDEICDMLAKAFITARDVIPSRIRFMEAVAIEGAMVLPGFIATFAAALAFYFFEERKKKVIYFFIFYTILLLIFAYAYPGFHLVDKTLRIWGVEVEVYKVLLGSIFGFFALVYFLIFILPKYIKEPEVPGKLSRGALIAITFSMAKRYSRLRKSRTIITVFSLTALIWAFTVLASIATVYGYVEVKEPYAPPAQGILVAHIINETKPLPLGYYDYLWFLNKTGVKFVAPRVYALPESGLKVLISVGDKVVTLKAILGLSKYENEITKIGNILVSGKFEDIAREDAIIIPEHVATALGVKVGDVVTVRFKLPAKVSHPMNFTVIGIFSPTRFDIIKDINNKPLKPIVLVKGKYLYANSTDIAIFNWMTLLKKVFYDETLGFSSVNSIYTMAIYVEGSPAQVRKIARTFIERKGSNFIAWVGIGNECWKAMFGMKTENIFQENIAFIVPILIVSFNVIVSMYSIVHERRREIYIFNAIGFNPTQIAMIFLAESIVYGLLAGGIGYIAGIVTFKVMTQLAAYFGGIVVREKLEWYWSIIAITISVLVSMISAFKPALHAAFLYSPTIVKKYKIEEEEREKREELFLRTTTGKSVGIPVRIFEYEAPIFFSYFYTRLKDLSTGYTERTEQVEELPEEEYPDGKRVKRFKFKYIFLVAGGKYELDCETVLTKLPKADYYTIELTSTPAHGMQIPLKYLDRVALVVSDICKEWLREKKRLLGG